MRFRRIIFALMAVSVGLAAKDRAAVDVYVIRLGHVPLDALELAETRAQLLFSEIGIRIRFQGKPTLGVDVIELRVWDEAPRQLDRYTMGTAAVGDRKRHASVFYDRVIQFSDSSETHRNGAILGYVIAHEIGHLLRDEPTHEADGVMKACWSRRDANAMVLGILTFTKRDAERMFRVLDSHPVLVGKAGE